MKTKSTIRTFIAALAIATVIPAAAQGPRWFPSNFYPPRQSEIKFSGGINFSDGSMIKAITVAEPAVAQPLVFPGGTPINQNNTGKFVVIIRRAGEAQDSAVQSYQAFQLHIQPPNSPSVQEISGFMIDLGGGFLLRESPTLPSLGTVAATAQPDGNFQIDSFFDIFTELSVDGGATWLPASGPMHATMERSTPENFYPVAVWPPAGAGLCGAPGVAPVEYAVPGLPVFEFGLIRLCPRNYALSGDLQPLPGSGMSVTQDLTTSLDLSISADSGTTVMDVTAPVSMTVRTTNVTGTFQTEMIAMSLSAPHGGGMAMIRESPTLASTGKTTVREVPGGFMISSFFDVFTELSLDGGATWTPGDAPVRMEVAPVVKQVTVPTAFFPPRGAEFAALPGLPDVVFANGDVWRQDFGQVKAEKHRELSMPVGGSENIDIDTTVEGVLAAGPGLPGNPFAAPAVATMRVTRTTTGTFDTEMLALNISGGTLPPGTQLRESPTRQSLGKITLEEQPDGSFHIGSFFDIFTELSVDGGASWSPGDSAMHVVLGFDPVVEFYPSNFLPLAGSLETDPADPPSTFTTSTTNRYVELLVVNDVARSAVPPPALGNTATHEFTATATFRYSPDGTNYTDVQSPLVGRFSVTNTSAGPGGTQTFDTEMLQLDIAGGTLPPGTMLRESPTRASTGNIQIDTTRGGFAISSFFDVFTEISLDGGATWSPATDVIHLEQHGLPEPIIVPTDLFDLSAFTLRTPPGDPGASTGGAMGTLQKKANRAELPPNPDGIKNVRPLPAPGTTLTVDTTRFFAVELDTPAGLVTQFSEAELSVSVRLRDTSGPVRSYETEMLSLNLTGVAPGGVLLRESPTRASTGLHTVTALPDGSFSVDSFFDVFTELSVDGGTTWEATDRPLRMEAVPAPVRVPSLTPTLPQVLTKSPARAPADYEQESTSVEVPNLVITFPESHSAATIPDGGNENWNFSGSGGLRLVLIPGGVGSGSGVVVGQIAVEHVLNDGNTRTFDTEMLSLNLSGGTLPAGVMLRESPTLQSLGKTTLTTLPDGTYRISSFFDVFTELSTDGGTSWTPSDGPMRLDATNPSSVLVVGTGAGAPDEVKVFLGGGIEIKDWIGDDMWIGPPLSIGVTVASGDVNGDGFADTIAGRATGSSEVSVLSGAGGLLIESLRPYPGFTGGVNVAAGDVDGDGRCDIITAAGAGGGPHVKVFSGRTGAELRSFFAYPPTFTGGITVAGGDVNGDGFADIITGTGAGASGGHVKVFSGSDGSQLRSFFAFPGFSGGVTVAAGDLDGDGRAEIVAGAGPGGAPHVKVFHGVTLDVLDSFFAYPSGFLGGVYVGVTTPRGGPLGGGVFPDTTPPVLTVPGDLTVETTSAAGAVATFTTSATDTGSGIATSNVAPPSGNTFPIGRTNVTAAATDNAGNSATRSFSVTVRDTTPPRLTVPANITVTTNAPAGAVVTYAAPTATDAVGVISLTTSHASGATFPYGTTNVVVTARDAAGNSAAATFAVTVKSSTVETKAPVITLTAPAGTTVNGDFGIAGTVTENLQLASFRVTVNGVEQQLATDPLAAFSANVALPFSVASVTPENGKNVIVVEATDTNGNRATMTKTITFLNDRPALAGTYHALLDPLDAPAIENSGLVTVTVMATGTFSGNVMFADVKVPFTGVLQNDGAARFNPTLSATFDVIDRTDFESYLGALAFSVSETDGLGGTLSTQPGGGSLIATFEGKVAPFSSTNLVPSTLLNVPAGAPTKGIYNVAFRSKMQTPPLDPALYPPGSGTAMLTLANTGSIMLAGTQADGSKYAARGKLRSDNTVALFTPLYRKGGFFAGTLALDPNQPDSDISQAVDEGLWWLRPERPKASVYPGGWPHGIVVDAIGTKYLAPASLDIGQGVPDADGNIAFTLDGPSLAAPVTKKLNINPTTGKVTFPAPVDPNFKFSLAAATGIFTGSTLIDGVPVIFRGMQLNKGSTQLDEGHATFSTNRSGYDLCLRAIGLRGGN